MFFFCDSQWPEFDQILRKFTRFLYVVQAGQPKIIKECFNNFTSIFNLQSNLAKPSCGSSPLWLQHKIEYKKPLVLIPSIIGPFHNISTCLLIVISRAKTILHITYSCNTRILNFGQQLPMHKLLLYLSDDIGLLLISSQLVLKMMKPWQTPLAQSEHPARGEKKEQRERTQV